MSTCDVLIRFWGTDYRCINANPKIPISQVIRLSRFESNANASLDAFPILEGEDDAQGGESNDAKREDAGIGALEEQENESDPECITDPFLSMWSEKPSDPGLSLPSFQAPVAVKPGECCAPLRPDDGIRARSDSLLNTLRANKLADLQHAQLLERRSAIALEGHVQRGEERDKGGEQAKKDLPASVKKEELAREERIRRAKMISGYGAAGAGRVSPSLNNYSRVQSTLNECGAAISEALAAKIKSSMGGKKIEI